MNRFMSTTMYALGLVLGISCGSKDVTPDNSNLSVYYNGNIYTVDSARPWAEAMIVEGQKITYVGTDVEAETIAGSGATYINLRGSLVLPGIHDVHMHPLEASSNNFHFTIDMNETDPENYLRDVQRALNQNPGDGWLLGWGFFLHTVLEANRSPIEILDEASSTRPIAIMEFTSHSIWCNSRALELAGFSVDSDNPTGGVLMREQDGSLNGILIDNAGNVMLDLALAPTEDKLNNDYLGLLQNGLPQLASNGITSICDARTYWKRGHHEIWQRLQSENQLTVRVNLGLWGYPADDDATQIAALKALYSNDVNSLLKINQIKVYSDGIVHNTTAAMHTDYLINLFGETTNKGLNYFSENRLSNFITQLEPSGFDFHIHAIGNRGTSEALNAIAQSGTTAGRHRITHVEVVSESDYSRFAELNVTADCQVAGDFTNPENWSENDRFIGSANTQSIVPLKNLKEAGARITLSSDWDVSGLNPFVGIQNAVTRNPQNISLEDAIAAYTINAAYVMRQEDVVGSLTAGKEADFIVLDQNIFEISPDRIGRTQVLETYLKGNRIYPN